MPTIIPRRLEIRIHTAHITAAAVFYPSDGFLDSVTAYSREFRNITSSFSRPDVSSRQDPIDPSWRCITFGCHDSRDNVTRLPQYRSSYRNKHLTVSSPQCRLLHIWRCWATQCAGKKLKWPAQSLHRKADDHPSLAVCHNDFSSIKQRKLACQGFQRKTHTGKLHKIFCKQSLRHRAFMKLFARLHVIVLLSIAAGLCVAWKLPSFHPSSRLRLPGAGLLPI